MRSSYGAIRTADTVPIDTRGYDAGKKVKGRKRFIVTDTLGLLLTVHVMAAGVSRTVMAPVVPCCGPG